MKGRDRWMSHLLQSMASMTQQLRNAVVVTPSHLLQPASWTSVCSSSLGKVNLSYVTTAYLLCSLWLVFTHAVWLLFISACLHPHCYCVNSWLLALSLSATMTYSSSLQLVRKHVVWLPIILFPGCSPCTVGSVVLFSKAIQRLL